MCPSQVRKVTPLSMEQRPQVAFDVVVHFWHLHDRKVNQVLVWIIPLSIHTLGNYSRSQIQVSRTKSLHSPCARRRFGRSYPHPWNICRLVALSKQLILLPQWSKSEKQKQKPLPEWFQNRFFFNFKISFREFSLLQLVKLNRVHTASYLHVLCVWHVFDSREVEKRVWHPMDRYQWNIPKHLSRKKRQRQVPPLHMSSNNVEESVMLTTPPPTPSPIRNICTFLSVTNDLPKKRTRRITCDECNVVHVYRVLDVHDS